MAQSECLLRAELQCQGPLKHAVLCSACQTRFFLSCLAAGWPPASATTARRVAKPLCRVVEQALHDQASLADGVGSQPAGGA